MPPTSAGERDWLADTARRRSGCRRIPSVTNFLLVPIGTVDAAEDLTEVLLRAGIVTRTFGPPIRSGDTCGSRSGPARERAPARCAPDMAGREGRMTTDGSADAVRERTTSETTIRVRVDLDGSGRRRHQHRRRLL